MDWSSAFLFLTKELGEGLGISFPYKSDSLGLFFSGSYNKAIATCYKAYNLARLRWVFFIYNLEQHEGWSFSFPYFYLFVFSVSIRIALQRYMADCSISHYPSGFAIYVGSGDHLDCIL